MKKYFLSFLVSVTFICNGVCQQPSFIKDSLDSYITREMQRWNIPGVAIAIVKDGNVVVSKGYGVTDVNTKQPVDANTLFMIASNSKIFTGTSIALLAHQGRLSLNDKVITYLPYFKMYNDTLTGMVTVEDILSHRLGFETFQGDFLNWASNLSREELIKNISKNIPVYDFRDTWGYCNAGFLTAGEIVHAVTDTTWDDFIKYNFFVPMKMDRSSTTYQGIKTDKNACTPYTIHDDQLVKLNYDNIDNLGPAASINSCANDLSRWLMVQLNNGDYYGKRIFPEEVIYETRQPRSIVGDGHSGLFPSKHFDLYGLGIEMNDYEGREMISHTGGANGFVTTVCFIPEENLGIAILTNTDANYFFLACLYDIVEAYFEMPYRNISQTYYNFYSGGENRKIQEINGWYETARKDPKTDLPLKNYSGTYVNDVYGKMEVRYEGGKLNMYFFHHPQLTGRLQPLGENNFVCTYDPISWGIKEIPFTVVDNEVVSVSITVNDFIDYGEYVFVKQKE